MRVESGTYFAKYRDADQIVRIVSTGCRTEQAARQALTRLERDTERVKLGVVTHVELAIADAGSTLFASAVDDYIATLTGAEKHRTNTKSYLLTLSKSLHWNRPIDMKREDLERWLAEESRPRLDEARQLKKGRSARSRNAYQTAASSFANWCVRVSRLTTNPFIKVAKANIEADRRRQRRALTPDELQRIMKAAPDAPESPMGRTQSNPARLRQKLTGPERAEVYAVLAGTGLRGGELGQLKVGDVRIDEAVPHIELSGRITKNGQDDTIPLRADLVTLLRRRMAGMAPSDLVYPIPDKFLSRFDADCKRAGIPKTDERGRTIDIHALRTTFGTWLAKSGVAPRTAQALMRHSDIKLTMSVYCDPKLLDTAAAVATLPSVAPVQPSVAPAQIFVAPSVAPTTRNSSATQSPIGMHRKTVKAS
jgi:integrase